MTDQSISTIPEHTALYAAFDRYPSQKGSSVHIQHFASTLFSRYGGGILFVLGDQELAAHQHEDGIDVIRCTAQHDNFLQRTLAYGEKLQQLLEQQKNSLVMCHFRDPWSGVPILSVDNRRYKTVYEVNGLPSIELPFAFPHIAEKTLEKIAALEDLCLDKSDVIVVPSYTIQENLLARGVNASKIQVIPNGADVPTSLTPVERPIPEPYILYFGAVQPWQGVDTLLRAFARLIDISDLKLVICCSVKSRHAKKYHKLAEKLEINDRIIWEYRLSENALLPWKMHALVSAAPLTDCTRNTRQGCSPFKVLESMAVGVPVVASDLPVSREIIDDKVNGCLVNPERPAELARAIRILIEYPEYRSQLGSAAQEKIRQTFQWSHATTALINVYQSLENS